MMLPLLAAAAALTLRLSAYTCLAPCDVRAEVVIPRHADNRYYVVQLDGPMFRSSASELDGANAPVIQPPLWFKSLPPGEYEIVVVLYRANTKPNEVARVRSRITVAGSPRVPSLSKV
jgi:hypothetical protein